MANDNESSVGSVSQPSFETILKRMRTDIGWEFGVSVDSNNSDRVKCKLCGEIMSGGAYRMKQHVAHISGNVSACPRATPDDQARCRQAITKAKNKKKKEENIVGKEDEMEELRIRNEPHSLGPTDRFSSVIGPDHSLSAIHEVHLCVTGWVFEAGIPLNAINTDSFKLALEAIGQLGPGYKPPSEYELRELLKKRVDRTRELLKKHEEEWNQNGCSIMMDAWTDREMRNIMNLCVNCKEGTFFLCSKESYNKKYTSEHIFRHVDKCIKKVGPHNVVQVVTNNMAAAKLFKDKRPHIFWTSCATHTINLMLESISMLHKFKRVIDQAKTLTIFIYAHRKTLSLMRSFTKKIDIVRPGVTRFASSFLSLQSLVLKKSSLKAMFNSSSWEECKWAKTAEGKLAYSIVMNIDFWNGVTLCLKVFAPLVKVLRLVNGDRKPSMGFLYGELIQAKQDIKEVLNNIESKYQPIFEIIDARMQDQLTSPLHLTAYLLNPFYFFKDPSIQHDDVLMDGIFCCVEVYFSDDIDLQSKVINVEFANYRKKEGHFGKVLAAKECEKNDENYDPVSWWSTYGGQTPNLQRMAKRILSLTTSSFRCERIWNDNDWIRKKKMNKSDVNEMNNLVFVGFNAKLMNKHKRQKERNVDVLLASEDSNAQGWIVDGGDDDDDDKGVPGTGLTRQLVDEASGVDGMLQPLSSRVGELHENDFVSEDEEEYIDFEFESDEEQALEEYGEEELDA